MSRSTFRHVVARLRHAGPKLQLVTDAELLARFEAARDEDAFAELVARHGGLVRGAALRILGDRHAAEDVLQATFLVLARKAGVVRWRATVGPWLYSAAVRLARKARGRADSCAPLPDHCPDPRADVPAAAEWAEVMRTLDEELAALPTRLREPIVLCYLKGHTRDEAAELLGWSLPMLLRRLEGARKVLRARLARRGVALAAAGLGVFLTDPPVTAATASTTARAAAAFASTGQAAPAVATLLGLSRVGVRLKAALLLFGLVACGVGALASPGAPVGPRDKGAGGVRAPDESKPDAPPALARADAPGDPLPAGAVARLGSDRLRAGSAVHRMAFSPDGTKLVSWGDAWGESPSGLAVWDAKTGKLLRRVELPGLKADSIIWRSDGRGVVLVRSASEATTPVAWEFTDADAPLPKPLPPKPPPFPKNAPPGVPIVFEGDTCHAVSPDGKTAAVVRGGFAGQPRRLLLFPPALGGALEPGADARVLVELPRTPTEVRFTPDGKTLIVFSESEQPAAGQLVIAWDTTTGKEKSRFTAPIPAANGGLRVVAVADRHLALGLPDGGTSLWDLSTGKERKLATGHSRKATGSVSGTYAVAFAPGGKALVTGGRDNLVKLWDVDSGKPLHTLGGHTAWVEALAVSADGKTVASAGQDGLVRLWDATTGVDACPQPGHKGAVTAAAMSPDGRVAVTGGFDRTLRWWDAAVGKELRVIELAELVTGLAVSPDGRTVLAAVGGKRLRTWDLASGKETTPADLPGDILAGGQVLDRLAFTPDARHLVVTSGREVLVLVWPGLKVARRIELPKPFKEPGEAACRSIDVSPDGRRLISVAERHWSLPDPNGGQLGFAADGVVDVWDLATGKRVSRLAESPGTFRSAAFTPDGRVVLVGAGTVPGGETFAGELNLLDPAAGRWVRSFTAPTAPAGVPPRYPGTAVTSPDGRTLYVSYSGEVLGFEVATGKVRRSFAGHRQSILALGVSPDGRRLVTGGHDGTALVWDLTLAGAAKPRAAALTAADAEALWAEANGPYPRQAFAALAELAAAPDQAVTLLRAEVKPAPAGPTDADLDRVFQDLDGEDFATREKASKELAGFGGAAVLGVRRRVATTESPEVRQRAAAFLKRFDPAVPPPARVREVRAVELLEAVGTPEAKALLADLAKGAPGVPLTVDAGAALERLGRRAR